MLHLVELLLQVLDLRLQLRNPITWIGCPTWLQEGNPHLRSIIITPLDLDLMGLIPQWYVEGEPDLTG